MQIYSYLSQNYYRLLSYPNKKLQFIEFLHKHNKDVTPRRLSACDVACEIEGYFTAKDLQTKLMDKGVKSSNNGVWYWVKLLTWAGVIKKIVVPDPVEGLVWRFTNEVEELQEV